MRPPARAARAGSQAPRRDRPRHEIATVRGRRSSGQGAARGRGPVRSARRTRASGSAAARALADRARAAGQPQCPSRRCTSRSMPLAAGGLDGPCGHDARPATAAEPSPVPLQPLDQVDGRWRRDLADDVDPIEQRAAQAPLVARPVQLAAAAGGRALPARARVAGGDQHRRGPGNETDCCPRTMSTLPSSSGWRSASSAGAGELRAARRGRARRGARASPHRAAAGLHRRRGPGARSCGGASGTGARRPASPSPSPATL